MKRAHRAAAPNRPFRGFTLVELLVSVALTLFLLALFATLMQFATTGVREAKGINAIDAKLRNAVTAIKIDLNQIYLANAAGQLSPGGLFTTPDHIPNLGYFSIEENSRALSVGVDLHGNPVEHDHDDVWSFTARRSGATRADIFTGRAGTGSGMTANVNGVQVDLGTFLDTSWKAPASRQDNPNNGLVTSHFAEIVYFARHNGPPPTLAELGADPYVFADATAVQSLPALPRTMTLYRRQLLVLDDDALNRPRSNANGHGPVLIPGVAAATTAGGGFYNFFDVSATRELVRVGNALGLAAVGAQNAVHFNTLSDLSRREFRYGMRPFFAPHLAPFNAAPYTTTYDAASAPLGWLGRPVSSFGATGLPTTDTLRASPLSHFDSLRANAAKFNGGGPFQPAVHEYASVVSGAANLAAADAQRGVPPAGVPYDSMATLYEPWIGRPTWTESAHPAFPWWHPTLGFDSTMNERGQLAAYVTTVARGGDEDVLVRDVLSFDIKVLEDIAGYPGTAADGSGDTAAAQGAGPYSQTQDHDVTNAIYNAAGVPGVGARLNNVYQRRQTFVDLGYGADQFVATNPAGGNIQSSAANTVNTLDLTNYLFQLPPGPSATLTLDHSNFGYTAANQPLYVPGTPLTKPGAMAPDTLRNGAFGRTDAPFGVPLSFNTPDYVNGPDGNAAVTGDELPLTATGALRLTVKPGLLGADQAFGVRGSGAADLAFGSSDDNPFVGVPFKLSGQVGGNANAAGAATTFHPFNIGNLNPRNTYDSWSAPFAVPVANAYGGGILLPAYDPRPVVVNTDPASPNTYLPNPNFRPAPYPRPLKGIQIKLRVLERRTGIVREATVRHYFPTTPTP